MYSSSIFTIDDFRINSNIYYLLIYLPKYFFKTNFVQFFESRIMCNTLNFSTKANSNAKMLAD